jgi:hypothetical protein
MTQSAPFPKAVTALLKYDFIDNPRYGHLNILFIEEKQPRQSQECLSTRLIKEGYRGWHGFGIYGNMVYIANNPLILIPLFIIISVASFYIGNVLLTAVKYRGIVKHREKLRGLAILKRILTGLFFIGFISLIVHELFY